MKLVPFNIEEEKMSLAEAVKILREYVATNIAVLETMKPRSSDFDDYCKRNDDAIETVLKALDEGGVI